MALDVTTRKMRLDELVDDPNNPNRMTDSEFEQLKFSIQKFPQTIKPIVVRKKNMQIIDGNHRKKAMLELGQVFAEVKIVDCSDLEAKMMKQALNKIHGHHIPDADIFEFKALIDAGLKDDLLQLLDLKEDDLNARLKALDGDIPVPEVPDKVNVLMLAFEHPADRKLILSACDLVRKQGATVTTNEAAIIAIIRDWMAPEKKLLGGAEMSARKPPTQGVKRKKNTR